VGEVILRQLLAAQVRVHAAQAAKAIRRHARPFQIGQLNPPRIPDHDVFDVAFAVDERADLAARLVREFRQLACELRRHDLVRRDAARIEFFDAPQLIGLEPMRIAV
ncbi:MAG: hypothetical protein WCF57_00995, partial [Pyrinomonadaceae bacterium]